MNVIYQYWDGDLRADILLGRRMMEEYARRIGVHYIFEHNPDFLSKHFNYSVGDKGYFFSALKPIFDPMFDEYDKVLFADLDIFPAEKLQYNIFDAFNENMDVGMVPELWVLDNPMPDHKRIELIEWDNLVRTKLGVEFPSIDGQLPIALNSGVVIYSKKMRIRARTEGWFDLKDYVEVIQDSGIDASYYITDQPYIQYMLFKNDATVQYLDQTWNGHTCTDQLMSLDGLPVVKHYDYRKPNTKFNHCRVQGTDLMGMGTLLDVARRPMSEWDKDILNGSYIKSHMG